MAEQSERLHRLILDLLSLARIETGTETFVLQNVAIDEALEDCLDRQRPRAEARNQTLEAAHRPCAVWAWADEDAVGEILDNLIDNAVKYTPVGGVIRVPAGARTTGLAWK